MFTWLALVITPTFHLNATASALVLETTLHLLYLVWNLRQERMGLLFGWFGWFKASYFKHSKRRGFDVERCHHQQNYQELH
jgi:hypothetical protein